jgi:GNAT superfamily N-acetyltransferase
MRHGEAAYDAAMSDPDELKLYTATAADAAEAARLLHDFNTEFGSPSPGPEWLASRLTALLAEDGTICVLAGRPARGVALVTLRSNVWFEGPVALLDELYVEPANRGRGIGTALLDSAVELIEQRGAELFEVNVDEGDIDALRFYRRNGFTDIEPDTGERAFYLQRAIG